MQLPPKSLDQAAASSSSSSRPFLQRRTRKRIRCERRLATSPLIPLPLLRDAIAPVDEITQEQHHRLKLHGLVSDDDDDDDSDNDDMQEDEEQAVDFVGRSKRHCTVTVTTTTSSSSQQTPSPCMPKQTK
mmetsp:Transcript_30993/g.47001  ORF Transcript_30993/g.47001 Transcript_30993/m.47001 type:complete len:130 (-) Transcript_30993:109-498(-)|eukprot:15367140-Ditylum_brightwellii.AAC.2